MFIHLATERILPAVPQIEAVPATDEAPATYIDEPGWLPFEIEPEPALEFLESLTYNRVVTDGRCRQVWAVVPPSEAVLARAKQSMAADIDAAVAKITARYAPYLEEYKTRETQAREFAAANYTGPVPQQVAAFATPAGLTPQVATLTIIGQADALRSAQDELGVLRMRKYEVLRSATDELAITSYNEIMSGIRTIDAGLT